MSMLSELTQGLPDPVRAWRVQWLTGLLIAADKATREMDRQIRSIVRQRPEFPLIQALPYATETTLGMLIAATGDITRFEVLLQKISGDRFVANVAYFVRRFEDE